MLKVKWRSDDGQGEVCPDSGGPVTPDMVEEMVRAAIAFVANLRFVAKPQKVSKVSAVFFMVSKPQDVMEKQRKVLRQNKKLGTADPEPYPVYGWIEVAADSNLANIMSKFAHEKDRVERSTVFTTFMIQAMKV
ncbi:MAG: hypothetical protein HYT15_02060 [Candidatus Magasanikbacteria bacterium]|nr:hypothetical protein [Candidatus Magasanikbacteria bacterium]